MIIPFRALQRIDVILDLQRKVMSKPCQSKAIWEAIAVFWFSSPGLPVVLLVDYHPRAWCLSVYVCLSCRGSFLCAIITSYTLGVLWPCSGSAADLKSKEVSRFICPAQCCKISFCPIRCAWCMMNNSFDVLSFTKKESCCWVKLMNGSYLGTYLSTRAQKGSWSSTTAVWMTTQRILWQQEMRSVPQSFLSKVL